MMTQEKLINVLSAIYKPESSLARELENVTGKRVSSQAISNWKKNGISWQFRPAIAKLAIENKLDLPDEFLYRDID